MIRFEVLGPVGLTRPDGTTVRSVLAQPRRLALLARLAATDPEEFVPRRELLTLFWPERSESEARNCLRQALHYLRRSLSPDLFECVGGESLRLRATLFESDVRVFALACASKDHAGAISTYRGDFLEGIGSPAGPEFERWMDQRRDHYRRAFKSVAVARCLELETEGRGSEAIELHRRVYEADLYSDVSARRLMQGLHGGGRTSEALQVFQAFSERLATDLGTSPDEATTTLAERLNRPSATSPTLPPPVPGRTSPVRPEHARPRREPRARRGRVPTLRWLSAALAALVVVGILVGPGAGTTGADAAIVIESFQGSDAQPFTSEEATERIASHIQGLFVDVPVMTAEDARRNGARAVRVEGRTIRAADELILTASVRDGGGRLLRTLTTTTTFGAAEDALRELAEGIAVVAKDELGVPGDGSARSHLDLDDVPSWLALEHLERSLEFSRRNRWSLALPEAEAALAASPDWTGARLEVAIQLGNDRQLHRADSMLSEVLARKDELQPWQRTKALFLKAALESDPAARMRAVRAELDDLAQPTSIQLVFELLRVGRPVSALEELRLLDENQMIAEEVTRYWFFQGNAHHSLDDWPAQLHAARDGLARWPDQPVLVRQEVRALAAMGRVEAVLAQLERQANVGEFNGCCATALGVMGGDELAFHGWVDEAERVYERTVELWNLKPAAGEARARADLLIRVGRLEDAERELTSLLTEAVDDRATRPTHLRGSLGVVAAMRGQENVAREWLAELDPPDLHPFERPEALLGRARIHAALREGDEAIRLLREARAFGLPHDTGSHDPVFAFLRDHYDFQEWLRPAEVLDR